MENAEYAKGLLGDIVVEEERIVYQGGISGIETCFCEIGLNDIVDTKVKIYDVEYIESTGAAAQVLDTGVIPTSDTRVVLDIMPTQVTGGTLFGGTEVDQSNTWRFFNYSSQIYFDLDGRINGSSLPAGERATIELGNYYVNKNGTRVLTGTAKIKKTTIVPLYMFGEKTSGSAQRLYSVKIYEGENLIQDYVPRVGCLGNTVKIIVWSGMYERISETYLWGTGFKVPEVTA